MGAFEVFIFHGNRHGAVEEEENVDTKFASQACGEPDAVFLPSIVNGKAYAGQVSTQQGPNPEGNASR